MKLLGKRALVTGAAQGIGKGCALALARAGADVTVNDLSATAKIRDVQSGIQALGRHAYLAVGDVFQSASCEDVVAQALTHMGRIDILVSNPAVNIRKDFLDYDDESWTRVLQGVLFGGFFMSRTVARHMVQRGGGGKIVFISSTHARTPFARSVAYNAGKSALGNMAFTIANELSPHRINVNVIEPGWIDTPAEHATFSEEQLAEAASKLPWGRLGTPDDIGRAAVFLASDDADYITGASLLVDGGQWLKSARE